MNLAVNNLPVDAIDDTRPLDYVQESVSSNPVRQENRAVDISLATGIPTSEVSQKVNGGDKEPVRLAKNSHGDPVKQVFDQSVGQDPETVTTTLRDTAEKQRMLDEANDYFLEGSLVASDPNFSPALARILVNQQIANEVIESKFTEDKGLGGKTVDFIDRYIFRYLPIGLVEDLTKRSERKGLELAQAAAQMSPEEYRSFIEQYADELSSEGFFKSDNYFALQEGLFEAINGGYDPMANVNQLLGAGEAAFLLAPALRAGRSVTRVGALKGHKAATEAAEALSEASESIDPTLQTEILPRQYDPSTQGVKPLVGRMAEIASNNKLVKDIQYLHQVGTFGRVATREQVNTVAQNVKQNVEAISTRAIAEEDIVDLTGLGDWTSVFRIGKTKTGEPWTNTPNGQRAANKYAQQMQDKGLAAKVVQADPLDSSKGVFVEVAERLDLTKVADPVDLKGHQAVFTSSVGKALGSTMQVDDLYLNTLANMGESGAGALREVINPYLKPIEDLGLDSKVALGQVFKDLRDGPDAYIRDGYSELEFSAKWKQYHPKGKAPTEADIEAFYAAKTINDASWMLEANKYALRYTEKGYKAVKLSEGAYVPGRPATDITKSDSILNVHTGRIVTKSDLPEDTVIWRTDRELEGGITLVTQPQKVRAIQYEDIFGYNAGGPRTNPDARYFVTFGEGRGTAMLTAFTSKQARQAAEQLEEIFSVVRQSGRKLDELTDQLDDVIARNNDWNPSIENTSDFVALALRKNWDVNKKVSFKARNDVIEGTEQDLWAGMTMNEYVRASNNRKDDVLMEFGGNETFNYNPIQGMVNQLSNASSEYAFRAYTYNSKVSWLKAAGYSQALEDGASIQALWKRVDPTDLKGERGRRLRELRAIIDRRDQVKSPMEQALSDFGEKTAEWVFDKSKGKFKIDMKDLNVEGTLLNLGFRSAFGFFNLSQFFLQSSHAFTIAAISPTAGSKSAAMVIPLRLAMASSNPDKGLARLGKFFDIPFDDMKELQTYINTSGRKMIENDAIEKGTGPGFGYAKWEGNSLKPSVLRKGIHKAARVISSADQAGLSFFNEGERMSRWTGITTAFLEYKTRFKGASALTDNARAWITRREQDLNFNMTTASRGWWQSGLMKVPTQWLSYSMRAMENVVVGRGFTKAERIRMAMMLGTIGGTTGTVVLDGVADQIGDKYGIDPKSPAYTALQYGWYDGIMTWGLQEVSDTDIRTAFGTRLAPLTAFSDLYRKLVDDNAIAAIGGPSGEIVGGALHALYGLLGNLVSGNTTSSWSDIERVLRTPSGIDNIYKTLGMINTGSYRSKSGTQIPLEFDDWEAALQAAGITNFRVAEFYRRRTQAYRSDREFRAFRREIENDFSRAIEMWDSDSSRAAVYMDEIIARIEASGFSPMEQNRLKRSLITENNNELLQLSMRELQRDNLFGATVIDSLTGDK